MITAICHTNSPKIKSVIYKPYFKGFRVVLGQTYRDLTGEFLFIQIFSVAVSVSPHVSFILDLIFDFYLSKIIHL